MREAWRWFGPTDIVELDHIRQAGASDIVTALYHIPIGEIWPLDEIVSLRDHIAAKNAELSPLEWSVVESIPIHDDIKRGADTADVLITNFITTMRHLAEVGIKVICYNFMPVIDWTRTDLTFQ
ncbi:MAG: mannonate dehydratase, partial [Kordiimonadaceae bacterium]|nr:mannonate dehydratase [Kordiimonadaceae bacterium]